MLFAKVSAPCAAAWNAPDCATHISAALHVYTFPPLSLSLSVSPSTSCFLLTQQDWSRDNKELTYGGGLQLDMLTLFFHRFPQKGLGRPLKLWAKVKEIAKRPEGKAVVLISTSNEDDALDIRRRKIRIWK
ncbi:hypothetical protein GOODEAATRI_011422 [Goodea atripinnis]|uniref:Uncharacterized protein n=1 Tax=Goodea atripinnis TaxID=208336 RepID=A0ABV0PX42_9TELE